MAQAEANKTAEVLRTMKKKRGVLKAKLTLFERYVESVEGSVSLTEINRTVSIELGQRIRDLEDLIPNFEDVQAEIEYNIDDDDEEQLREREEFYNRYYTSTSKAKGLIELFKTSDSDNSSVIIQATSSQNSQNNCGIKLPDIKLPKFDGSFQTWLDFRDIFESLIHDNSALNEIQKFHYLRASLVGSATQVIRALEFSAKNYNIAWKTLCERFNNNNLLIQNHISAIFNLEKITTESAEKIRNLSDNLFKHLSTLKQLGEPTDHWDTLLIYICSSKLDSNSSREWEKLKAKQGTSCKLEQFKKFLRERADLLENMEINSERINNQTRSLNRSRENKQNNTRSLHTKTMNKGPNCFYCKEAHSLFYCSDFLKLSVPMRNSKVKELKLCINCLRPNHISSDCKWSGCRICGAKHNSVLHKETETTNLAFSKTVSEEQTPEGSVQVSSCNLVNVKTGILPTARVKVRDACGNFITARALLDCGSQSSFITSELHNKLRLQKSKVNLSIVGIDEKTSHSSFRCNLKIKSASDKYSFDLNCFILDRITSNVPGFRLDHLSLSIPKNITLADPEFHKTEKIDLLIGSDAFWNLLCPEKIQLIEYGPVLQKTKVGWVVAGPFDTYSTNTICNLSSHKIIQDQLARFWEVEEISNKKPLSSEEELCEKHFIDNLEIDTDGRYIVSYPLKSPTSRLGDSREIAIKRFSSLERKLMTNETLKDLYTDFLREYEQLGHMTEVTDIDSPDNADEEYVMPHHGVLRDTSSTTRLRVVFNASSPSSSGISLNDLQMNGPVVQSDILSIILRFRMRAIAISGDIKMMYRQILINPKQRKLQRIAWRSNPNEPIKIFELNTVTYGTKAGSFLATRCLNQVAHENDSEYPKIARIIREDMYVDDLLTGVDTLEEAEYVIKFMAEVLSKRGFDMRKWKSNNSELIRKIQGDQSENKVEFLVKKETDNKVLGLVWVSDCDVLTYSIPPKNETSHKNLTKRSILSKIATIFDPLGLISPVVIVAKVLLQGLWARNLNWDQPLPEDISIAWLEFTSELEFLNDLFISRRVVCDQPTYLALHGFSDASATAYGACVYVVSKTKGGEYKSELLCAKSKVAPLKSLTMPRLELCGALTLANLLSKVTEALKDDFDDVYCWSDSTIVLGWLQTSPNLLKPFVDNRVAEIQRITKNFEWKHVPTKDNPADFVSRGMSPKEIIDSKMWWHGPDWLIADITEWPKSPIMIKDLPEIKNISLITSSNTSSNDYFPFERFSDLTRLKRTAAYVFRFYSNCRKPKKLRNFDTLSVSEINHSFYRIIKQVQRESFPSDYLALEARRELSTASRILNLKPFLDSLGLMRVGGRLSNSNFSYSKKHPILLPSSHILTKLVFRFKHESLLHAGPQLLLASIREQFWPISGRSVARQTVRNCVKCTRYSTASVQPVMGDLPSSRVQQALPFVKVGIDYAGPFSMKDRRGRGCKVIKCWVAVFVCFTTRAIHLELILSLSTDDFLQAFNRFVSRRGMPAEVFSDNGTTFVKANKDLQSLFEFFREKNPEILKKATDMGITWHFIPVNAPHFGGIWEAGVKSLKHHLKRVVGSYTFFFYDFQTLLVRIEAVLNSRPICPLTSCPDDLIPLTPAHFLLGRAGSTVPEGTVLHLQENRLSQFQLVQKVYEQFWNRWQREYVSELQTRQKWNKTTGSLRLGQLVLIKEDHLPPMRWRMGRVLDLFYGKDGVARVARVKTAEGVVSRALVKLCPLPVESSIGDLSRRGACTVRRCLPQAPNHRGESPDDSQLAFFISPHRGDVGETTKGEQY